MDYLYTDLLKPREVNSLSFSLLTPLPNEYAGTPSFALKKLLTSIHSACLYYSPPPFVNTEYMGAVANEFPSDIIQTGFPLNPDVNEAPGIKLVMYLLGFRICEWMVSYYLGKQTP